MNGEISVLKKRLPGIMGDPPILAPLRPRRFMDQFSTLGALDVRLRRHLRHSRDQRRAISMSLHRLLPKGRKLHRANGKQPYINGMRMVARSATDPCARFVSRECQIFQ